MILKRYGAKVAAVSLMTFAALGLAWASGEDSYNPPEKVVSQIETGLIVAYQDPEYLVIEIPLPPPVIVEEEPPAPIIETPKYYPPPVQHYPPTNGGGDPGACVRAHESDTSGGYSAVNPAGYYGAYQFSQSTWDNQARAIGRFDLVGVRPDQASPADQDLMFETLYDNGAGAFHWKGSGC
jgi:hypothetical protein